MRLDAVFGLFREAVLAVKDGRVVYANAPAERLLGRGAVGSPPEELLPGLTAEDLSACRAAAVKPDGREMSVSVAESGEYTILSVTGVEPDGGTELLHHVAGELNNRLSVIRAGAELLAGQDIQNSFAPAVTRACYALMKLAGNLEILSGEGIPAEDGIFDAAELCRLLTEAAEAMTAEREVSIRLRCGPGSLPIRADRRLFQRLLLNLLSNSVKYTDPGGVVEVTLRQRDDRLELIVADTGRGVRPERLRALWQSCREETDTRDGAAGAGMGLSVVRRIAEHYGGSAAAESVEGRGTVVTVSLRVIPDREELEQDAIIRSAVRIYGEDEDWPTAGERRMLLTELSDAAAAREYLPGNVEG